MSGTSRQRGPYATAPRVVWPTLCLVLVSLSASAERSAVRLHHIPDGAVFVAWCESGIYDFSLPAEWHYTVPETGPVKILLANGDVLEPEAGATFRFVGVAKLRCRAVALRAVEERDLLVELTTDRLEFAEGTRFQGPADLLGDRGEAEVMAISQPGAPPVRLEYDEPFSVIANRLEWRAPDGGEEPAGAEIAQAVLPAFEREPPAAVLQLGLWSAAGLRVDWSYERGLTATTAELAWIEVNGESLRRDPLRFEAPRAEIAVRRATFAHRAPVVLPAAVREPDALLAEDVTVSLDGAPGVIALGSGQTAEALRAVVDGLAPESGLRDLISDYLLPMWAGLWYDARDGREECRETPTLAWFEQAYSEAADRSRPVLLAWLREHAAQYAGGTFTAPEPLLRGLETFCDDTTRDPREAAVWWSVYLSDLLSAVGRGPVGYRYPTTLTGAPQAGDAVALPALLDYVDGHDETPLLLEVRRALREGESLPEVRFARLGPGASQPLAVVVDAGRRVPVGTYSATVTVTSRDGYHDAAELTVRVLPSYGQLLLQGTLLGLPAAVLGFLGAGLGRRRRPNGVPDAE